ncbi:MAG TPA: sensor histidine kinase [Candidatus Blautia ornithocaccae]|nr:sensor histidine kinase [Candidatus Blautia ornithocaccae]
MRKGKISNIQKKYLIYTLLLLALTIILSSVGVWIFMRKNMTEVIVDNYVFMNEKMGMTLDYLYTRSDETTAECILDDAVQDSLKSRELEEMEKNALSKYFAYLELEDIEEYCYVDNKKNVYTKSYSKISYEDFRESELEDALAGTYAETKWFLARDTLFGTGEEALFIGRYVRNMEYSHEPGMIFFKMNDQFLERVIETQSGTEEDVAIGIIDKNGNFFMENYPENFQLEERDKEKILSLTKREDSGVILTRYKGEGGILQAYRQQESGMVIFTLVPNKILDRGLNQIFLVLAGIYAIVTLIAVAVSLYFSRIFTKPIQMISREMTSFDGKDFSHTISLHTDTELDQIGESYNKMLGNIERLLTEIKKQEKELRVSEMNMLISQIKPHFLYNTLDTIYMLARINGEKTTMKMIQALSGYLRLSLSKGGDMVTVEDELDNVKNYLEIQKIRNEDLFSYEISCQPEVENRWTLKLILQPLAENAIKYGFCDIFEGGLIRIDVRELSGRLTFSVYNNGKPMDKEIAEKINDLGKVPVPEMKKAFPDKQKGYGVINIATRLRLKYGDQVEFGYEVLEEGTRCVIKLPVDGKENYEQ